MTPVPSKLFNAAPMDFDTWAPIAIIATVAIMTVPGLLVYLSFWCSSRQGPPPKQIAPVDKIAVYWLACLTASSFLLLLVQVGLGCWAHSLALMADLGHSAADAALYCFAFLVEYVKIRFGAASVNSRLVAWMDRVSALFSIIVVVVTSVVVTAQGLMDISKKPGSGEEEVLIGPALLTFAAITLALNGWLVYLQYRWLAQAMSEADDFACGACDDDVQATEDQPLLPPGRKTLKRCTKEGCDGRSQGFASLERGCKHTHHQESGYTGITRVIHMFLHPGCGIHAQCIVSDPNPNLNLTGVNLHLVTDVARTFLMLILGLLVSCHMVKDHRRADAGCALVVCLCVVFGSIVLLRRVCEKREVQ